MDLSSAGRTLKSNAMPLYLRNVDFGKPKLIFIQIAPLTTCEISTLTLISSNFQIFAIYFQAIGPGRAKIKNVVNFGNINIYKDTNEPSKYHDLCEKMIKALIKDIIIVVLAIIISYWTFGAGTLYAIFFQGARVTFLSTELPFFDINTTSGYAINFIQQSSTTIVGIIANISIEICGCLAYNAIETVPDLFHLESEELAKELKLNGMSLSAKLRVRNILMQAQDLNM